MTIPVSIDACLTRSDLKERPSIFNVNEGNPTVKVAPNTTLDSYIAEDLPLYTGCVAARAQPPTVPRKPPVRIDNHPSMLPIEQLTSTDRVTKIALVAKGTNTAPTIMPVSEILIAYTMFAKTPISLAPIVKSPFLGFGKASGRFGPSTVRTSAPQ